MKNRKVSRRRASFKGIAFVALLFAVVAIPAGLNAAIFNSNSDPNILPMLNGFSSLPQATLDDNDAKVIAINNGASGQEQSEALEAARYPYTGQAGARYNLSNTKYLGGVRDAYLAADAAGEVPLVNQLLAQGNQENSNHMLLKQEWASADDAKDVYQYQRPYCRLGGSIQHVAGGDYSGCPTTYGYPSGHSMIIWTEGISLAVMLPELAPQIMTRSAEIANYRSVLGVHYPLDLMASRAIATRMVAYRLHDDTWKATFDAAKTQLRNAIETRCGMTVAACVATTPPSMSNATALAFERDKLTYGFTPIGSAGQNFQAPDHSYELLTAAFPSKSQAELEDILESTAIDSGYPLDITGTGAGTAHIGWTRLDLAKALTYVDAGQPGDTTAPTVTLTAPTNGQTVSGTTALTATASDNVGVTAVEFRIDGTLVNTDTTEPYSFNWDSSTAANGNYDVTATAYDAANNSTASTVVAITVDNAVSGDTTNPTVTLTAPTSGQTISGTTALTANANDNVGVTAVEFRVDGTLVNTDTTAPYAFSWNSDTVTDGSHSVTATARDAADNSTTSTAVSITVDNSVPADSAAPIVTLEVNWVGENTGSSVEDGGTVSGNTGTILQATANDNVAVTSVQFFLDGQLLGESTDNGNPYDFAWDTTTATNGSHTLTARAYDAANNVGSSANFTVIVDNQATDPDPETEPISFELPGVKAGTTASFEIEGVCAQSVTGQSVAAVPAGLDSSTVLVGAQFMLSCSGDNGEAAVALALDKAYTTTTLKIFKQAGAQLDDITSQVTIATENIGGANVSVIRYTLQDGGFGDEDGTGNRQVVDPIFVTFTGTSSDISGGSPSTPDTGFRLTLANPVVVIAYGLVAAFVVIFAGRKLLRR